MNEGTAWMSKPLQYFYPALAELEIVRTSFQEKFGDKADDLLTAMRAGSPLATNDPIVHETMMDLVEEHSVIDDSGEAEGDFGPSV